MALKIGSPAKLAPHTVEGVIIDIDYDKKADEKKCLLSYKEEGENHTRWFFASQLVDVEAEAAVKDAAKNAGEQL